MIHLIKELNLVYDVLDIIIHIISDIYRNNMDLIKKRIGYIICRNYAIQYKTMSMFIYYNEQSIRLTDIIKFELNHIVYYLNIRTSTYYQSDFDRLRSAIDESNDCKLIKGSRYLLRIQKILNT